MGNRGNLTPFLLLTLLVPSLQSPCLNRPNCSLSIAPCSQKYIICISDLQQNASCQQGQVFYNNQCVSEELSPECQKPSSTPSPTTDYDCSSLSDGQYSLGCVDRFVSCVSGHAYLMFCPAGLVYDVGTEHCESSCGVATTTEKLTTSTTVEPTTSTTQQTTTSTTEQPTTSTTEQPTTSTTEEVTTTTTEEPTTTEEATTEQPTTSSQSPDFDCSGRPNGVYDHGCAPTFIYCVDGTAFTSYCPPTLVFNVQKGICDYDCNPSTVTTEEPTMTTTTEESTTTTAEPETTPFATLVPSDDDYTSTTTTTQTPIQTSTESVCFNNEVTIFGTCPTHFVICQENKLKSKQCPTNTVYDLNVFLCVYGRADCVSPSDYTSPFGYPQAQPQQQQYPSAQSYAPNPFYRPQAAPFAYSFPSSTYLRPGQQANFIPNVLIGQDEFRGPLSYQLASDINSVFPPSPIPRGYDKSGRPMSRLPARYLARLEKKNLDDDSLLTGVAASQPVFTRKSSSFPVNKISAIVNDIEGSGEGSGEITMSDAPTVVRTKRSYGTAFEGYNGASAGAYGSTPYEVPQVFSRLANLNVYCQGISVPTFLFFGQCQSDFVYCSGTGVNKLAACPVGELFDNVVNKCLALCGATPAPVTTTTETPFSQPPVVVVTNSPAPTATTPNVISTSTSIPTISDSAVCHELPNGPYSLGGCSQQFIFCVEGVAIKRNCPSGLYFDQENARCEFSYNVALCNGDTTTAQPAIVTEPTQPAQEEEEAAQTTMSTVQVSNDVCLDRVDGAYAISNCSAQYINCVGGAARVENCPTELVFDQSCNRCEYPHSVRGCASFTGPVVEVPQTSTTTAVPYRPQFTTPSDDASTSIPTSIDACTGQPDGVYAQGCTTNYLLCASGKTLELKTCPQGQAFNSVVNCCTDIGHVAACEPLTTQIPSLAVTHQTVPLSQYTTTTTTTTETPSTAEPVTEGDNVEVPTTTVTVTVVTSTTPFTITDDRCINAATNSVRVSGTCRPSYIKCVNGQSVVEYCGVGKVFSVAHGCCVARETVAECSNRASNPTEETPLPTHGSHPFCLGKVDGLYRNPHECTSILQCFGGDLFEYPSCPAHLSFNEKIGQCDYPQNVPGCTDESDIGDGVSKGCTHGDFLEDHENCSKFYRCVWGRRVQMDCPASTVFNPLLSVCDWPDQVPGCIARSHSPKFRPAH